MGQGQEERGNREAESLRPGRDLLLPPLSAGPRPGGKEAKEGGPGGELDAAGGTPRVGAQGMSTPAEGQGGGKQNGGMSHRRVSEGPVLRPENLIEFGDLVGKSEERAEVVGRVGGSSGSG